MSLIVLSNPKRAVNAGGWRLQLLIDSVIDYAIHMIDIDGRS
jgi:hypothetical protein